MSLTWGGTVMISPSLFKKEVRESRWKIIIGLVVFVITAVSIPLTFKYVQELLPLIEGIPGMGNLDRLLEDYNMYAWSQWNGKNLYQVGTILAIVMGMNLVAGEKVAKTLEFLLARPVSRGTLYFTKFAAGLSSLALVVFGSTVCLFAASALMGYTQGAGGLFLATLVTYAGLIFVFTLTYLVSTVLDEPVKVGLCSALVLLLLSIPGWFPRTRWLSLFRHMSGAGYVLEGNFPLVALSVILLLTAGMYYLGSRLFEQKQP